MEDGLGAGRLEVIAGPMFAGKSEELLRRVRRARIAGRGVLVVSHALDTRRGAGRVTSHSGAAVPSRTVSDAAGIPALVADGDDGAPVELVAIDEAQFFGAGLVPVVSELAEQGLVVVVAGLSVTFDGQPFAPLPELMALAESVEKLTAVCSVCGADAAFHVRVAATPEPESPGGALVPVAAHVGGAESYEARCRRHLSPG
ncbi:thymidine kinase [Promicromonospora thailandica]|uniref:Thymidine kinase n=1 Tax=Promicromonospora thailandica TaxID=765201 RepID=A0A9X2G2L0_9MICO|nr:thymidine kinase [Promicromonospora thailandica]MCP2264313.1 thymidine kinase [Promicromonospora thailandica]BFF21001.1 thymidine kinase [Promicromonospora thailandica]